MLKKVLYAVAILAGAAIGGLNVYVLKALLDVNAKFITGHRWITGAIGVLGLLFFADIVRQSKVRSPRSYGLFVLGIGCGVFLQAICYLKLECKEECQTDFLLKLAGCVILMVDGFSSYDRKPAAVAGQGNTPAE